MPVTVYLGTHEPAWLKRTQLPLFVSRRRLARRKSLPRAIGEWACDSGGFTELSHFGAWTIPAAQYVDEVRRYQRDVGGMQWAAIQDWMCEPPILKMTGLNVREHQRRTIDSYVDLRMRAPEVPWTPVLQGWVPSDYFDHVDQYRRAGVDLASLPIVGLGSVCRRQHTTKVEWMIRDLAAAGLRLHGFGFKVLGLTRVHDVLASSDSMAWSFDARRAAAPLPECRGHKRCQNCFRYAARWYADLQKRLTGRPRQPSVMQLEL